MAICGLDNVHIWAYPEGVRVLIFALLVLPTQACASINYGSAPQDWPKLKIEVREVSQLEVIRRCSKYSPLSVPLACAEVHFRTVTCVIWITKGAQKWVMDHEVGHCWGNDHHGESTLRDAWADFKVNR